MPPAFPKSEFRILLERLASTPGPTDGETPRRKVLEDIFTHRDVPFRIDDAGNLLVAFGKGSWEETVIFDAHIDVVERGYVETLREEAGRLIGLGVCDDLTAVTLLTLWAMHIHERKDSLCKPLLFCFSVGEEGLGNLRGMRQLLSDHPAAPKALFCFDLSMRTYSTQALGSIRFRTRLTCPGGHSWENFGQPSAIHNLNDFLHNAKNFSATLISTEKENASFNIGGVNGGEGINSIARTAEATYEFRAIDPAVLQRAEHQIRELTAEFHRQDNVTCRTEIIGQRPAGTSADREWITDVVLESFQNVGITPVHKPASTNINTPVAQGWPAVCVGLCDGGQFHREDEYLILDSLPTGWAILQAIHRRLFENP